MFSNAAAVLNDNNNVIDDDNDDDNKIDQTVTSTKVMNEEAQQQTSPTPVRRTLTWRGFILSADTLCQISQLAEPDNETTWRKISSSQSFLVSN